MYVALSPCSHLIHALPGSTKLYIAVVYSSLLVANFPCKSLSLLSSAVASIVAKLQLLVELV